MVGLVGLGLAVSGLSAVNGQPAPRVVTVIDDLDFPTGIAFSRDGTMFVNERGGRILRVEGDAERAEVVAEVETTTAGETGLLGVAVSPDDAHVYAFVTDPSGTTNRVVRVPATGGDVDVIVDSLPAAVYHNGGGVSFDREGMLLVSNGENHETSRAQDPDALGGKIYRFTPDGSAASGNPFGDAIAIGLRNPFGLTVDPVTGDAFVTENGPGSFDEIDRIRVGGNYGWPDVSGPASGDPDLTGPGTYFDPLLDYESVIVPTGIAVADPATARDEVAGDLFFGSYGEQAVHRVRLDADRDSALSDEIYVEDTAPVVAVAWGPEGLYYSTPEAVKLIPLARPTDASTRTPRRIVGPPLRPDGSRVPWRAIAVAVIVGAALFFVLRRARG